MTNPDFPLYTSMHTSTSNCGQSLCRAASMNDSSGDCPHPRCSSHLVLWRLRSVHLFRYSMSLFGHYLIMLAGVEIWRLTSFSEVGTKSVIIYISTPNTHLDSDQKLEHCLEFNSQPPTLKPPTPNPPPYLLPLASSNFLTSFPILFQFPLGSLPSSVTSL